MLNYQTETNTSTDRAFGVFALGDKVPKIHKKAWIAPTALVIGDVEISEGASSWFNAVLRGDRAPIYIGKYTNIQDGCVIHSDGTPVYVGDRVSVGHRATLHGCSIGAGSLIGINSDVFDRVTIGCDSIVWNPLEEALLPGIFMLSDCVITTSCTKYNVENMLHTLSGEDEINLRFKPFRGRRKSMV